MNPNFGKTAFDQFPVAALTLFIMLTLEWWSFVMYDIMDATSFSCWPIFVLLIVVGAFVIVNLALVIVNDAFTMNVSRAKQVSYQCFAVVSSMLCRGACLRFHMPPSWDHCRGCRSVLGVLLCCTLMRLTFLPLASLCGVCILLWCVVLWCDVGQGLMKRWPCHWSNQK